MFKLPELDYSYDALEPYIDSQTMELHHSKHHAGYVKKLNDALKSYSLENSSIEDLMLNLNNSVPLEIYWEVRNNGGGHLNHSLFFKMIGPKTKDSEPSKGLTKKIDKFFGNFENFKSNFTKSSLSRFGSGWSWLLQDSKGSLFIKSTANQDTPISNGHKVILGLDLWEHAYYLKYQNKRDDYIKNWWNIINWDFVNSRYEDF
jgi:Fe-Mn family superoxide dismutase